MELWAGASKPEEKKVLRQLESLFPMIGMSDDKFIRYLLTFTTIYFTIHVLIALARGTI
jgi:hypothetical protein